MIFGIDSRWLYTLLMGLVVAERLLELRITRRNAARLAARGGFQVGAGHYGWMVFLHSAFLLACPLEVWFLPRPLLPWLAVPMLVVLAGTMALRYWAIRSLGDRWTTQIWVVPDEGPVLGGPYRFTRHPNYLAVVLEVAALPLVHAAWLSAIVFSLCNLWLLRTRIRAEEAALAAHSSYSETLTVRRASCPPGDERRAMNETIIYRQIGEVLQEKLDWSGDLSRETRLVEDLELDSVRLLTLAMEVEDHFRIRLDEDDEASLVTVGDLVSLIGRKLAPSI